MAIPFTYGAFTVESGKGKYKSEAGQYYYSQFTSRDSSNTKLFENIRNKKPQCICLNDGLENAKQKTINTQVKRLNVFFEGMYPHPTPFEWNVVYEE